jgi:hypothetical protein
VERKKGDTGQEGTSLSHIEMKSENAETIYFMLSVSKVYVFQMAWDMNPSNCE